MRTTIQSVIGASIGGMAPTSLAVGVALVSETKQVADYGSSFFVGLLIFGILGGVVGYLWKEPDGKKAFNPGNRSTSTLAGQHLQRDAGAHQARTRGIRPRFPSTDRKNGACGAPAQLPENAIVEDL